MANRFSRALLLFWLISTAASVGGREPDLFLTATISPVGSGPQLVRASLPFPRGLLHEGESLVADDGHRKAEVSVRPLSYYPTNASDPELVRRALITFPYDFKNLAPVEFAFRTTTTKNKKPSRLPVGFSFDGDVLAVKYQKGPGLKLRMLAPARASMDPPRREVVESNAFFRWEQFHLADPQWPRIIEVRADAAGQLVVVGHLQRNLPGDGRAPDFGWEVQTEAGGQASLSSSGGEAWGEEAHNALQTPRPSTQMPLRNLDLNRGAEAVATSSPRPSPPKERGLHTSISESISVSAQVIVHGYTNGVSSALHFDNDKYVLYHPTAPLKRRGRSEARTTEGGRVVYRYWRCTADEKVPMQSTAWHRAELVIAPTGLARLTPTLQSPHQVDVPLRVWDGLYAVGQPLDLKGQPELAALLKYHHDAIIRSMALGDDMGNVSSYTDGQNSGGVFGMNRLNHCPPMFQEAWRSGDRRLLETALLWCDNFYDQSIWWGEKERGGTRYNNVIAQRKTPPDNDQTYMWRSNDSVNFCTKGYDSFWLAYEETGDPRMIEALEAQVAYAKDHVHADKGECRNIGDVREFIRLYQYTGQPAYLEQALRLFRELRTKLSTGDLFDQGGKPLAAELPFIDDDEAGLHIGYAKPYIIGYALTGLPELAPLAPAEPKLRDVIAAVADFLAESEDPLGGWRYPHPRSSYQILSQAIEHAWQLVQADRLLGAKENHLDAIELVLRQRIHGWQRTGKIFSGLNGWELSTGKIKERSELYQLYKKPEDRGFTRDYREGDAGFGSSAPEGLVYFPEVLAFYLQHRPASRLLAPPKADEPLGQVLIRAKSQ